MSGTEVVNTLQLSQLQPGVTAAHLEMPASRLQSLHAERTRLLSLHSNSARFRLHAVSQRTVLQLEVPRFSFQFERLSPLGLERFLARAVRRRGPLSLRQMARLLEAAGQRVWMDDVVGVLRSPAVIRFGQCTHGDFTLLPWERLEVPWSAVAARQARHLTLKEYEALSTAFWLHHRHVPSEDEEPSPAVRAQVAERLQGHQQRGGESGPYPYLVPDPAGPIELDVQGDRRRFRVRPGGLRPGHLGNVWLDGERRELHVQWGRIFTGGHPRDRLEYTDRADEVIVRVIAHFTEAQYQAHRGVLGNEIYDQLRLRKVRLRVNGQ